MAQFVYRSRRPIRDLRRVIPATPPPPAPAVEEAVEPDATDYQVMLKADLVELAEALGLDASGTKADIIARLSNE